MKKIGLKEAIGALRTELSEAMKDAANEQLRFEVGEINLEFQVELERAVEGSAGIKFYVVELGGKGSATTSTTHTVKIALKAVDSDGEPILTGSSGVVPE